MGVTPGGVRVGEKVKLERQKYSFGEIGLQIIHIPTLFIWSNLIRLF